MKTQWFKRYGWFHVPVSVPGIVVCLLAALFCITGFAAVDRHSHSASDTLYGVFPFFVCTFLQQEAIGESKSAMVPYVLSLLTRAFGPPLFIPVPLQPAPCN